MSGNPLQYPTASGQYPTISEEIRAPACTLDADAVFTNQVRLYKMTQKIRNVHQKNEPAEWAGPVLTIP
jgi:hypothetical protein